MSAVIIKQNNRFHCKNKRVLCLYCVITVALYVVKSLQNCACNYHRRSWIF